MYFWFFIQLIEYLLIKSEKSLAQNKHFLGNLEHTSADKGLILEHLESYTL